MLLKISWRNVWRNRQRSITMIMAITAGLWGGIMAASIVMGMMEQRFVTAIEKEYSHIQIHHPDFLRENNVRNRIDNWNEVKNTLSAIPEIQSFSGRTKINAMIASANLTHGIVIQGIDPEQESATTGLNLSITEGSYFEESMRNPLVIGNALAEKLKARLHTRLVITFQDSNNELVSLSARVAGIYSMANKAFEEQNIFMLQGDMQGYLDGVTINEIAILLNDSDDLNHVAEALSKAYPKLSTRTWADISPHLAFYNEMGMMVFTFILIIILLALAFGLLNTMLMSVFERSRELGMLMSIGMNKKRIFSMILLETTFLSLSGAFTGILISLATLSWFGKKGLDLSVVGGDALNDYGFDAFIYPQVEGSFLIVLTFLVLITALLTSIYPALKALRLRPAEAVRAE